MNGEIKRYIYTIGTIIAVFFLLSVFLHIMPWLILAGVVGYIIIKIIRFVKGNNKKEKLNNYKNNNDNDYVYEASTDDYTNGEIIDVEYEDVDEAHSRK